MTTTGACFSSCGRQTRTVAGGQTLTSPRARARPMEPDDLVHSHLYWSGSHGPFLHLSPPSISYVPRGGGHLLCGWPSENEAPVGTHSAGTWKAIDQPVVRAKHLNLGKVPFANLHVPICPRCIALFRAWLERTTTHGSIAKKTPAVPAAPLSADELHRRASRPYVFVTRLDGVDMPNMTGPPARSDDPSANSP